MAFSSSDSAFRITPACAGKRIQNEAEPRKWTDHPRVCGEKMFSISGDVKYPGSPPRVRGKVGFIVLVQTAIGITPACAGKRKLIVRSPLVLLDHPRVCGEKLSTRFTPICTCGSPPRVRGKATSQRLAACRHRITPACAGKRLSQSVIVGYHGDHPRVCGEKTQSRPAFDNISGSPPRVRGKGCWVRCRKPIFGITPACAGKRKPL